LARCDLVKPAPGRSSEQRRSFYFNHQETISLNLSR
jgi:hypothetical protein